MTSKKGKAFGWLGAVVLAATSLSSLHQSNQIQELQASPSYSDSAQFDDTTAATLQVLAQAFFDDEQSGLQKPGLHIHIPSEKDIIDKIESWVVNSAEWKLVKSDVNSAHNLVDRVSSIEAEVQTLSDQIDEKVSVAITKEIEPELEKIILPVLEDAFEVIVDEFKPILKQVIDTFEGVAPDSLELHIGPVELQWNDIDLSKLDDLKNSLDKTPSEIKEVIQLLEPDMVGLDIEIEAAFVIGSKSAGFETIPLWDTADFLTWLESNGSLLEKF